MAVTQSSFDNAEVTYCYEVEQRLGVQVSRRLPWAFVKLGGDERTFVVPANALGLMREHGQRPAVEKAQVMINAPFPLESARGPNAAGEAPGPHAVHFLGDI